MPSAPGRSRSAGTRAMVDTDTDRTGPGDRDRRLQKGGSQVAATIADALRGLLPHGGQASVSVLPPEPGLGSVLDAGLLAAHHLAILTEGAAISNARTASTGEAARPSRTTIQNLDMPQ